MFTSPKCLLPLVSLAYVYSNISLVTLAKCPGNKNAFNNSMNIWYLRIFLCVTGWLNHSPPPPASSFWPRLANNTRAGPFAPSAPPSVAGGPRWLLQALSLLGLRTQCGFSRDLCFDLVQSENALNSEPKDLPWKPGKARQPHLLCIFHICFYQNQMFHNTGIYL